PSYWRRHPTAAPLTGSCSRRWGECCRRRYLPRPARRSRSRGFHGLSPLVGHTPHPILARAHHRLAHSEGPCPPGLRALYSRATLGARGRRRVVPADLRRACHRRLSRRCRTVPDRPDEARQYSRRAARAPGDGGGGARRRDVHRGAERVPFEHRDDPARFLGDAMVRELTEQVEAGRWRRDDRAAVFRPKFTSACVMTWQALPPFSMLRRRRLRRRAEAILEELNMAGPD